MEVNCVVRLKWGKIVSPFGDKNFSRLKRDYW